jgi:hypothetical protein
MLLLKNRPTAKQVYFVYSKNFRYSGSTVMRGQQLADIAEAALGGETEVSFAPISRFFKNSSLFLTKGALAVLPASQLESWKRRGNKLFLDPVDGPLTADLAALADAIVAASKTAYDAYTKAHPTKRVILVNHHVDPRLRRGRRPVAFRAGYFGELVNTIITPAIEQLVSFVLVDTSRQDDSWLMQVPKYSFHYAIRHPQNFDSHKPFIKGFTAAYYDANLLIQASQKEAAYWLGRDYPYLLKGEPTEERILEALTHARESFDSAEWRLGLERMRAIRQQVSPQAIGRQLIELFG